MAPQDLRIETLPIQRLPVKKALLIALQYPGKHYALKHTYGDADHLRDVLIEVFGFKPENITVLKDDGEGILPTREVMLDHMRQLVANSIPGDRFVFHFSGHGDQRKNVGHDTEDDGLDETIWPADVHVDDNNVVTNDIIDDLLSDTLLPPVCVDARLVIIFDSCHSGTAADPDHWSEDHKNYHPKKYRPSRRSKALNLSKNAQAWSPVTSTASGKGSPKAIESALESMEDDTVGSDNVITLPETPRIVSWAACADPQVASAVPVGGGVFVKVFTKALRQAAKCGETFTHGRLLDMIEEELFEAVYQLLLQSAESSGKHPPRRETLKGWRNMPKPQLLGLPNLEEVKNFFIHEMF